MNAAFTLSLRDEKRMRLIERRVNLSPHPSQIDLVILLLRGPLSVTHPAGGSRLKIIPEPLVKTSKNVFTYR